MDTIGNAKTIIRAQLEAHGWTGEHLAELAGLSQSTLSRFMRDTTDDVRFSTLQAHCRRAGVDCFTTDRRGTH